MDSALRGEEGYLPPGARQPEKDWEVARMERKRNAGLGKDAKKPDGLKPSGFFCACEGVK